jgi:hypothetical protein
MILGMWWLCSKSGDIGSSTSGKIPLLVENEELIVVEESAEVPLKKKAASQVQKNLPPQLKSLYGDMMRGGGESCSEAKPVASAFAHHHSSAIGGATAPLVVDSPLATSLGGLNMPGSASTGTALASAFEMTAPGKEYMDAYNPTGLASVMPAGWRSDAADPKKCASTGDASYAEFSRYSITPEAVARSENMRSVMRLSENTRQGLGRTLGYQSLLRNYVTPIGPQPIGDKSMLWNDSSVRQGYIAAVQGSFPPLGLC